MLFATREVFPATRQAIPSRTQPSSEDYSALRSPESVRYGPETDHLPPRFRNADNPCSEKFPTQQAIFPLHPAPQKEWKYWGNLRPPAAPRRPPTQTCASPRPRRALRKPKATPPFPTRWSRINVETISPT